MSMTHRLIVVFLLVAIALPLVDAKGADSKATRLYTKAGRTIIGELERELDDNYVIRPLLAEKTDTYQKTEIDRLDHPTDNEIVAAVGLPTYLAWKITAKIPRLGIGKIAEVTSNVAYVTLGDRHGVLMGQALAVFRVEGEIKDPDTGEVLERRRDKIAEVEVVEVRDRVSKVKLLGTLEVKLAAGDEVEPVRSEKMLAVLPLVSVDGAETVAGKSLSEELTTLLVGAGLTLVERNHLDRVIGELGLQQSTLFDPKVSQKVGKQLGAFAVLSGTLVDKGKYSDAHVRLVRVDTGEILLAATHKIKQSTTVSTPSDNVALTEADVIGIYDVEWSDPDGKGTIVYELLSDHTIRRGNARPSAGSWSLDGGTIRIAFSDRQRGGAEFTRVSDSLFAGSHTWMNGKVATWTLKKRR